MTHKEKIILVMGKAGAGKSTFAKVGEQFYGWSHVEMANRLHQLEKLIYLQVTTSWSANRITEMGQLYPNIKDKEMIDICNDMECWYEDNAVVEHNNKRRNALQYLGTEIMRHKYGEDVHCIPIIADIYSAHSENVVVSSVRFFQEIDTLTELAIKPYAVVIDRQTDLDKNLSTHQSENEWQLWCVNNQDKFNVIRNEGTLSSFLHDCAHFYEQIKE